MHEIFRHSTFTSTTLPHATTSTTTLNGLQIPKGILVFINQYAANHDPNVWENPDEFLPERFLTSSGTVVDKPHERYFLFSYGSRKCPGDEISRLILLHIMANILTLCSFESDPDKPLTLDGVYNLSMRPKLLRTKIHIRKPQLLESLTQNLAQLSPHVKTVNSCKSSPSESNQLELNQTDLMHSTKTSSLSTNKGSLHAESILKNSPFQAGIDSIQIGQRSRK